MLLNLIRNLPLAALLLLITSSLAASSSARAGQSPSSPHTAAVHQEIEQTIEHTWALLRRDPKDLLLAAKGPSCPPVNGKYLVYVSPSDDLAVVRSRIRREVPAADFAQLSIETLPKTPQHPGLLYLPHPYVVPGGMFNEMYGWDSFFINLGLVRAGKHALVRNMTDNLLYEIEHFGHVLNANRSYFLSRSQPPLITLMVKQVMAHEHDLAWLRRAMPQLKHMHDFWVNGSRQTPTGLSRYYDNADGPAPEVASHRDANGQSSYDRVVDALKRGETSGFDASLLYNAERGELTDFAYKSDRAMRESGFDVTDRFGPFGLATIRFNPVCLNTFLVAMEQDLAEFSGLLGDTRGQALYRAQADLRAQRINALLWDQASGLYADYDTVAQARRMYPYATTFIPLWAGIASPAQAARVVANLHLFEAPGGLRTSTHVSRGQWETRTVNC